MVVALHNHKNGKHWEIYKFDEYEQSVLMNSVLQLLNRAYTTKCTLIPLKVNCI